MSNKVKKLIPFLVMMVILALLTVGIVLLKNRDASADAEDPGVTEESGNYTVFESDSSEILVLKVTYEDEIKSFYVDDEGVWVLSGEEDFPLDESAVTLMLTSLAEINSDYRYEGIEDFSEYGLEEPWVTISVDMGDDPVIIKVGDQYPYGSSRYISVSDFPDTVFVAPSDLYTRFAKTKLELVATDSLPYFDGTAVNEILFSVEGYSGYDLFLSSENPYDKTGCNPWCLYMEDGRYVNSPAEKLDTLLSNASSFAFTAVADYRKENFADYGLDENSDTLIIRYMEQVSEEVTAEDGTTETVTASEQRELKLFIGNKTDDGYRYVNMEGSDLVCTLSEARIADLSIEDPYVFETDNLFALDLTGVSSIRVSTEDFSHQFSYALDVITVEGEEGEEPTSTLGTVYYMDGELLDDDRTNKFIGAVADLSALKKASDRLNRDGDLSSFETAIPVLITDYEMNDGNVYNVSVYEYDESYYLVFVDYFNFYRIDRRDVDAVIASFSEI